MPRRRRSELRYVPADPRYNSEKVARFVNKLMERGKKSTAQRILYEALDQAERDSGRQAVDLFEVALRNATPLVQVRPRRVGGATYQVPVEVRPDRGATLAMRWLIMAARERKGAPMRQKLASELMDAARGQGAAVRRRENLHRMAEANQAFAHYRW